MKQNPLLPSPYSKGYIIPQVIIGISLFMFFALVFFTGYKKILLNMEQISQKDYAKAVTQDVIMQIDSNDISKLNTVDIEDFDVNIGILEETPYYHKLHCTIKKDEKLVNSFTYYKEKIYE